MVVVVGGGAVVVVVVVVVDVVAVVVVVEMVDVVVVAAVVVDMAGDVEVVAGAVVDAGAASLVVGGAASWSGSPSSPDPPPQAAARSAAVTARPAARVPPGLRFPAADRLRRVTAIGADASRRPTPEELAAVSALLGVLGCQFGRGGGAARGIGSVVHGMRALCCQFGRMPFTTPEGTQKWR